MTMRTTMKKKTKRYYCDRWRRERDRSVREESFYAESSKCSVAGKCKGNVTLFICVVFK